MKGYTGTLIVFEGINGSGKTTQANKAYEYLTGLKIPVMLTVEPTGRTFGTMIRNHLLSKTELTPRMELLCFILDRLDHVNNVIRPELLKGTVVLCDRFTWSTVAHQAALGANRNLINLFNDLAVSEGCQIEPDETIFYDTELKTALSRKKEKDRHENYDVSFHTQVIGNYKRLIATQNCFVVDGNLSIDEVWKKTQKAIDNCLQLC